MNPLTGLDVIRTNLILKITVEDGVVRVVVDLPVDHQFASAIKEDITEKLGSLWDVKEWMWCLLHEKMYIMNRYGIKNGSVKSSSANIIKVSYD